VSLCSASTGDGDEASTADVGLNEREPMASDVVKALETAMLWFEKQDVCSVKCKWVIPCQLNKFFQHDHLRI